MTTQSFFEADTLTTMAGSTAVILALTNAIRMAAPASWGFLRAPLVPFLVSLIVGFAGASIGGKLSTGSETFIAFANSCLLFCTALGVQEGVAEGARGYVEGEVRRQSRVKPDGVLASLFSSWIKP